MDYFVDVLSTFLGLERVSSIAVKALVFYQKYPNLCFECLRGLERHEVGLGDMSNNSYLCIFWLICGMLFFFISKAHFKTTKRLTKVLYRKLKTKQQSKYRQYTKNTAQ